MTTTAVEERFKGPYQKHLTELAELIDWLWSEHDEQHHHRRRYTRSGLIKLLEAGGLRVRKATYFNTALFPAIAAIRLLKRALGAAGADDENIPPAFVNRVLTSIFSLERHMLRRGALPFGVSILAIAGPDR